MRRFLLLRGGIIIFLITGICVSSTLPNLRKKAPSTQTLSLPSKTPPMNSGKVENSPIGLHSSLFIPYWTSHYYGEEKYYDAYYYFGVVPTAQGMLENELGLQNIASVKDVPIKKKKLVLRMLNSTVTEILLKEKQAQTKLISQLRVIMKEHSYSGIAFDIEIPFSLNTEKPIQITNFVQKICSSIKSDYKTCDLIVYGDVFYRRRPYDMQSLAAIVDKVLIMAYDFHKSSGEPGPNFSFNEKEKYGYDFKTMVQDFSSVVPKEKLVVIFGMYGYDWTLNEQGMLLKSAEVLTLKQIKNRISTLTFPYSETVGKDSKEKTVSYVDDNGKKHLMWWEDEESVQIKAEYLKVHGIGQVSYWAHGYF